MLGGRCEKKAAATALGGSDWGAMLRKADKDGSGELDWEEFYRFCRRTLRLVEDETALKAAGATLLNQAVLLAGVNDDRDSQVALSEALFAAGVMPYYLHLLDRVAGVHHFEVDETRAAALMRSVAAVLPGYLVPKLARELPGDSAKRVVGV